MIMYGRLYIFNIVIKLIWGGLFYSRYQNRLSRLPYVSNVPINHGLKKMKQLHHFILCQPFFQPSWAGGISTSACFNYTRLWQPPITACLYHPNAIRKLMISFLLQPATITNDDKEPVPEQPLHLRKKYQAASKSSWAQHHQRLINVQPC